ncbi:MAG: hypothetical protein Q7T03_08190 [Deltaproteobacteria bacterium]|nr:hypothetical protein [Deltaproteobacteria bacterium]
MGNNIQKTKPQIITTALKASEAHNRCGMSKTVEACEQEVKAMRELSDEAGRCPNPNASQYFTDENGKRWVYTCDEIQQSTRYHLDNLPGYINRLRIKKELDKNPPSPTTHTPTNKRPEKPKIQRPEKMSLVQVNGMQFSPSLADTYIRLHVYNSYDARTNRWISAPRNLISYHTQISATHHYSGPLFSQKNAWPYQKGDLLAIPLPADFTLDATSVRLNGKKTGFDLVQDDDGIIYARLTEKFFKMPEVQFGMSQNNFTLITEIPPGANSDLLPSFGLPQILQEHFKDKKFYGAEEKYEAAKSFVLNEFHYPAMKDILNGSAIYPEKSGGAFYTALSKMKWADCDVANGYGVILLRKQGVPARLVGGLLIQEGEVGHHGWVEYFDDHLGQWMTGDMTPPAMESENTANEDTAKPRTEWDEPEPVRKGSFAFRLEKNYLMDFKTSVDNQNSIEKIRERWLFFAHNTVGHGDNLPIQPYDTTWAFRGEDFYISKPDGRYLVAKGNVPHQLKVFDLERETFFTVPVPKEAQTKKEESVQIKRIEETAEGLIFYSKKIKWYGGSIQESRNIVFNQKGERLAISEDFISTFKIPPIISKIDDDSLPQSPFGYPLFGIRKDKEDPDGNIHLLYVKNETKEIYKATIQHDRRLQGEVKVTLADLGEPVFTFHPDYGLRMEFSADASHFSIRTQGPVEAEQIDVFKDRRFLYRTSFKPLPDIAIDPMLKDSYTIDRPQVRLNNDGSLDIKQVNKAEALVMHINPDGKEDKSKRVRWTIITKKAADKSGRDQYEFRYETNGQSRLVAAENGHSASDPYFKNISFNGYWIMEKNVFGGFSFRTLDANANINSIPENCTAKDNDLRCFAERDITGAGIFNPFGGFDFDYHTTHIHKRSGYGDGGLERRENFNLWKQRPTGWPGSNGEIYADVALVNTQQDTAAYALKKMLQDDPAHLSLEGLRILLGSLAERPEAYLHHQWLLLGAATLFDSAQACRQSATELIFCQKENTDADQFLKQYGPTLAQRLKINLTESGYFPNPTVVARGWAYLLSATLDPEFFEKMALNPDRAAEAIIAGVEAGYFHAADLPPLTTEKELKLDAALNQVLTHRQELIRSQTKGSNLLSIRLAWAHYKNLETDLFRRFGKEAMPMLEEGH